MTAATIYEVAAHTEAADDARRAGFEGLAAAHDALAVSALRAEVSPRIRRHIGPEQARAAVSLCDCGNRLAGYCNHPRDCDLGE